jgi:hypothetical protein
LFYATSGTSAGPNFPIGKVTVDERDDRVVVQVFEDTTPPPGEYGSMEFHAAVNACVEVQLREDLRARAIHDATGPSTRPLSEPSPDLVRTAECVRWKPRKRRDAQR